MVHFNPIGTVDGLAAPESGVLATQGTQAGAGGRRRAAVSRRPGWLRGRLLALVGATLLAGGAPALAKPNIVLVMADDMEVALVRLMPTVT